MPLIKRTPQAGLPVTLETMQGTTSISEAAVQEQTSHSSIPQPVLIAAKARATKDYVNVPMTKDSYWERKEARDIRTGECIRLSGVLQALLGSVNYGQYCITADRASYLAQVRADAKELAKFITEEA